MNLSPIASWLMLYQKLKVRAWKDVSLKLTTFQYKKSENQDSKGCSERSKWGLLSPGEPLLAIPVYISTSWHGILCVQKLTETCPLREAG